MALSSRGCKAVVEDFFSLEKVRKKCCENALDVALSSGGCKAVVEGFFSLVGVHKKMLDKCP